MNTHNLPQHSVSNMSRLFLTLGKCVVCAKRLLPANDDRAVQATRVCPMCKLAAHVDCCRRAFDEGAFHLLDLFKEQDCNDEVDKRQDDDCGLKDQATIMRTRGGKEG